MKRFTQSSILRHLASKTTRSTTDTDTDTDTVPLPPHYAMAVFGEQSGKVLNYRQLINHPDQEIHKIWQYSVSNEFGRTMQGVGKNRPKDKRIKGTDTM
jgi:hypothetical protein